jgi:hypothetical protein
MKALRRFMWGILAFSSWGLALYLFFVGNVGGGFGALVSSLLFVLFFGFGVGFAERFGSEAINKAKKEGFEAGMKYRGGKG